MTSIEVMELRNGSGYQNENGRGVGGLEESEINCDCDYDEEGSQAGEIQYLSIYDDMAAVQGRIYFIPALPITATIVDASRDRTGRAHPINRYIYTIHLKHGPYEWTVQRRYIDFFRLNNRLKLFQVRTKLPVRSPFSKHESLQYHGGNGVIDPDSGSVKLAHTQSKETNNENDGRRNGARYVKLNLKDHYSKLAKFPIIPDSFINEDKLKERKARLQEYLSSALHIYMYRNRRETASFVGVSRISFVRDLGGKFIEGLVKQRPGGEHSSTQIRNCCLINFCDWKKRWLVIKDTCLIFLNSKESMEDVILYDADFQVYTSPAGGRSSSPNCVMISNLQRDLLVKCHNTEDAQRWVDEIWRIAREDGEVWLQPKRHGSSFPIREYDFAVWFVDGRSLMESVADLMEMAKEEIFITGWWLTPHIYMKRPIKDNYWRLDRILKRKAEAGIRIYILIYNEFNLALSLNSDFTEEYLTSLHPRIQVIRHPDHNPVGVYTWAHHEKAVVVDQIAAFVGGIDLCYGRWDDHEHRLSDLGNEIPVTHLENGIVEGSVTDVSGGPTAANEMADKVEPSNAKSDEILNLADIIRRKYQTDDNGSRRSSIRPSQISGYMWPGKDYVNFIHKDIPEPEKPFEDFVDRTIMPRLPWHDIGSAVYGSAARDVARHFIQRWNAAKFDSVHVHESYPHLIPKSYSSIEIPQMFQQSGTPCKVQVLRSASLWSTGMNATECSITNAYLHMISHAKHYIYIENQFFISQLGGSDVCNFISKFIFDRILRAHKNNETFRVYIIMPLLPAFERQSAAMQVILHWTYLSISQGPLSLMTKLKEEIGDPSQYITFCSLRKHEMLVDKLMTELIYVHSKLIITDDRYCLIGSANINDRSQTGDRDSELALFVEDTTFVESKMNGEPYEAGVFSSSLRGQLFSEHLGLLNDHDQSINRNQEIDIIDPVTSEFFNVWNSIARKNTEIYEQVFECPPSNRIRTLEQLAEEEGKPTLADNDVQQASKLLAEVKGYLVMFPTEFLADSELAPSILTAEGLMPTYVFV